MLIVGFLTHILVYVFVSSVFRVLVIGDVRFFVFSFSSLYILLIKILWMIYIHWFERLERIAKTESQSYSSFISNPIQFVGYAETRAEKKSREENLTEKCLHEKSEFIKRTRVFKSSNSISCSNATKTNLFHQIKMRKRKRRRRWKEKKKRECQIKWNGVRAYARARKLKT